MIFNISLILIFISIFLLGLFFIPRIIHTTKKRHEMLLRNAEKKADALHLSINTGRILKISLALSFVFGFSAAWIFNSLIAGLVLFSFIAVVPFCLAVVSKRKRRRALEKQLPDIIEKLSAAIKAGSSLQDAFGRIGTAAEGPFGQEALHAIKEVRLGLSLEAALNRLANRAGSEDVGVLCTALVIALNTGGNLSEMLENTARSLREKRALEGKIGALTSQGRMQGIIIGLLPLVLLVFLYFLDPGMVRPLFETSLGKVMLSGGLVLEIIGLLMIKRIVDIRY